MRYLVDKKSLKIVYIKSYDFLHGMRNYIIKRCNPLELALRYNGQRIIFTEYDIYIYIINSKPIVKFTNEIDTFFIAGDNVDIYINADINVYVDINKLNDVLRQLEAISLFKQKRMPLNVITKLGTYYVNNYYTFHNNLFVRQAEFNIRKFITTGNHILRETDGPLIDTTQLEVVDNSIVVWNSPYFVNTYLEMLFTDLQSNGDIVIMKNILKKTSKAYPNKLTTLIVESYLKKINLHKKAVLIDLIDDDEDDLEYKYVEILSWNDFGSPAAAQDCFNKLQSQLLLYQLKSSC